MSKQYRKQYIGIIKDICPKCKSVAERVGIYYNKILKAKMGWNCENCRFKELAESEEEKTKKLL